MTSDSKPTDKASPAAPIDDAALDEVSGGPIYVKVEGITGDIKFNAGDGSVAPAPLVPTIRP